jgi:tetratricopeptide (TPR) repeat protein
MPRSHLSTPKKNKTRTAGVDRPSIADPLHPGSHYRVALFSVLLVLVTVAVYSPIVHNSFVNYDDDKYILGLPQIQQPFDWKLIHWAFTAFALANWHPLTWLSHAVDFQLFQSSPVAIHLENVFLHTVSSVLLFVALQNATGKTWRSLLVAALFALHPVNVESVAWAAERKNVLSMLFFLLALWSYGRYAERRTMARYFLVFAAFAFGLMAKPQIVTLPFVLLLWDIWPLRRWTTDANKQADANQKEERASHRLLLLEKVPLFLLAAGSSIITVRAQAAGGAVGSLTVYPIRARIANAMIAYTQYLLSMFWPTRLAVLYPYPSSIPVWQAITAVAILLMVTTAAIVARRRPYLGVGWFWFLGTMVPMIGLVQVGLAARADRYMYLPAIGLFVAVVWGIADWAEQRSLPGAWLTAGASAMLLLLAALTFRQVGYWRNGETLWKHALEVTDGNAIAEANLGTALFSMNHGDEALEHLRRAVAIDPGDFLAQLFLGINEGRHGNPQGAVAHLQIALQRPNDPDMVEMAYANLGNAYRNLRDYAHAQQNFRIALGMNPTDSGAAIGMGLIAQHDKNLPEAIHWYSQAMEGGHPNAVASLLMADALEKNGQISESKEAYQQAARFSRDLSATQRVVQQMLANLD